MTIVTPYLMLPAMLHSSLSKRVHWCWVLLVDVFTKVIPHLCESSEAHGIECSAASNV